MKLRVNERCPIHGRRDCCGRGKKPAFRSQSRYQRIAPGLWRIPDPTHPRGFRERRSKAAMRPLLAKKVLDQGNLCGICSEAFLDARDVVPDHIEPKGSGGARRDDHPDNIQAAHSYCNGEKGSKRISGRSQMEGIGD